MSRLPSHGFRFGLPPKLHGHEIVQLQLSATVAVMCQFGSAARGGAVSERTTSETPNARARVVIECASYDRSRGGVRCRGLSRRRGCARAGPASGCDSGVGAETDIGAGLP